jgi:hypothetical protein
VLNEQLRFDTLCVVEGSEEEARQGWSRTERNGMATTESGDQHSVNHEMGTGPQTPARPTEFDCG